MTTYTSTWSSDAYLTNLNSITSLVEKFDARDMGPKEQVARYKFLTTIPTGYTVSEGSFKANLLVRSIILVIPSLGGNTLTVELLDALGVPLWSKTGITQSQTISYFVPDTSNVGVPLVGMNSLRFTLSGTCASDVKIISLVYGT